MLEKATLVLVKSEKGAAELAAARPTLNIKSRQLLILADGLRSLGQIRSLRPSLDVYSLADVLVARGFLHDPSGMLPAVSAPRASLTQEGSAASLQPPIDPDRLAEMQALMIATARQYLGLLGEEVVAEIARSRTRTEMRNCVAQWHMALRQSRHGKASAQQLLERVQQLLES